MNNHRDQDKRKPFWRQDIVDFNGLVFIAQPEREFENRRT